MPGAQYFVDIVMNVKGSAAPSMDDLTGKTGKLGAATDRLNDRVLDLGRGGVRVFTSLVEGAGRVAIGIAKIGTGAVIGAAVNGVMHLNQSLETSRLSVAAVLNAQPNSTGGMPAALEKANSLMGVMRKHAVDLPGEFQDLFGIFQTGLGAAMQNGASPERFERMSANAMAAAKAIAVPMDMAGREMAQLIGGRAGMHNVFGSRLGINAHKELEEYGGKTFNKLSGVERMDVIEKALQKYQPSIEEFGKTFEAESSTFADNLKQFNTNATSSLFGSVKETLHEANEWFSDHRDEVDTFAAHAGYKLKEAWNDGKKVVLEWGPLIIDFADRAYDRIVSIWRDAAPYVEAISGHIKGFLKDPESLDKIGETLKLYAQVRAGTGALGLGAGALKVAAPLYQAGILGGGGAAAGAAGKAGAGLLGMGGLTVTGIAANALGFTMAQDSAKDIGKGKGGWGDAALVAGFGGLMLPATMMSMMQGVIGEDPTGFGRQNAEAMGKFRQEALDASTQMDSFGTNVEDATSRYVAAMEKMVAASDEVGIAMMMAAENAKQMAVRNKQDADELAIDALRLIGMKNLDAVPVVQARQKAEDDKAKKLKEASHGRGGITVHKIEMTVTSNQAPGQIARRVVDQLRDLRAHPRMSPHVADYTARG